MIKKIFPFLLLLLLGCQSKERTVSNSFYYWKQSFQLNEAESNYLNKLNIKNLYIKYFDVAWSVSRNEPTMVAPIRFKGDIPKNLRIVPTVFITNQTMIELKNDQIENLATLILENVNAASNSQSVKIGGLQIDCDWSPSSRDKYFELLKVLKSRLSKDFGGVELSATIRLHQVKFYKKTGIPPVDRGTLMFYNMDAVTDETTRNSILDLEIAKQYFYNFDEYQLPLDVALPLFRWGVVNRRGRVVNLLNHIGDKDLADTSKYIFTKENHYQVTKSHYLNGFYLYTDDKIRLESVSLPDLKESAQLLNDIIKSDTLMNVTYYHLDSTALQHYSTKEIQSITNQFYQ